MNFDVTYAKNKFNKKQETNIKSEPVVDDHETDDKWIERVKKIEDPVTMLKEIVANQDFLGYDPYYGNLRSALLNQADKIVKGNPCTSK